jgi:hypothetical protein
MNANAIVVSRPCSVCPTLAVALHHFNHEEYAVAGSYVRDAVDLFVDSFAMSRGIELDDVPLHDRIVLLAVADAIGETTRADLYAALKIAKAAERGDDCGQMIHATYMPVQWSALRNSISWLFEYANSQPYCSHDYIPAKPIGLQLGRKAVAK